jgi:adenylate cyclase
MGILPLHALYRRLGRHYPVVLLAMQFSVGTVITAGTLALITFYYETSERQFLELLLIAEALTVSGLLVGFFKASPRVRPIKAWIAGARDEEQTAGAWDAAVNLPVRMYRHIVVVPSSAVAVTASIACVVVLDLRWTNVFPLMAGAMISVFYAALLQYFAIELALRPVVEDIASRLPTEFPYRNLGMSLRARLILILPLTSLITGLVVATLTGRGSSLALSVVVTTVVAVTISLELALLMAHSVTRPIDALTRGLMAVREGRYDVKVPVTTSDEVGTLSYGFNRMVAGLAERERLREAFGTYLDKDVAEYILKQDVGTGGVEVEVSILFCDVRDFTGFAERAGASEVVERLNQLFEVVVPIVARHGGHIDKFVGDGLIAVFGAPEPFRDHADRAVAAGTEMVSAVEEGVAGELRIGVGINSGRVIAGSIGGGGRLNFSVIGDPVNIAARVEAVTRETGDDLLITAATRDRLRRDVPLVARGAVDLKGKSEPVEVFAVGSDVWAEPVGAAAAHGA